MVKNRYYTLNSEFEMIKKYVCLGLIPIHILTWKTIYEFYLDEILYHSKMQAYQNTAENYRVSEKTIRNIVAWMRCI